MAEANSHPSVRRIVAADDPGVAFIVLMAGPGENGFKVLLQQGDLMMKAAGATCDLVTVEGGEHGMDHWEPHPELHWYKKALVDWLTKTLQ